MNLIVFAVILGVIIVGGSIGISAAPPPNAQEKIAQHVTNDNAQRVLQKFDISQVEKGSQITSTNAVFTLTESVGDDCVLVLNEPHLNKDEISDPFVCGENNIIPLKTIGNHALQSKLNSEQFNIEVKSINSNGNVTIVSSGITLDISYLTPTFYALIEDGQVTNSILADQTFIDTQTGDWVSSTKSVGVGHSWDGVQFTSPQPFSSWMLDENNVWQAPIPSPTEGYSWDESNLVWVESLVQ